MQFLKMYHAHNLILIVTEKSTTSITCLECFMKLDVCAILYTFYGSVLTLICFAIFTENTFTSCDGHSYIYIVQIDVHDIHV